LKKRKKKRKRDALIIPKVNKPKMKCPKVKKLVLLGTRVKKLRTSGPHFLREGKS
jgi:hypothetical protein